MTRVRWWSALTILAALVFSLAFFARRGRRFSSPDSRSDELAPDAPDSVVLAAIGLAPGRQLIAFVFGGSRCGNCTRADTRSAVARLRYELRHTHSDAYRSIRVVGVAINTDISVGLEYLRSIGLDHFDEISVGDGWQNEQVVRWMWRGRAADPVAPAVIVVSRPMSASVSPITLHYGQDSVLSIVEGAQELIRWVKVGTPLGGRWNANPESGDDTGGMTEPSSIGHLRG